MPDDHHVLSRRVPMTDDETAIARAVVIATGATYKRLGVPSVEQFVDAGVFYGGARSEAPALFGQDVYVIGGGNAAGQAASYLSRFARQVTLVVRGERLTDSMSDYLIRELESIENLAVLLRTRVVDAAGAGRLEQLTLAAAEPGAQRTVPAAGLFVLIGTEPRNEWLASTLELDAFGFILPDESFAMPLQRAQPPRWSASRYPSNPACRPTRLRSCFP